MPVYEQKLISPIALRFTQEHIRTTFKDGRIVEDTIDEIEVRPAPAGSDYDLVLHAPFPSIEILRWRHPRPVNEEEQASHDSAEHWFTLDNRRLYCLQRAAMAHWPSRVAAEVDILYADHGRVWRKYDSATFGRSVSIGHSCKGPETDFWDWEMEADASTTKSEISSAAAFSAAQRDNERATVEDLTSAEEVVAEDDPLAESLARLARMEAQCKEEKLSSRCITPSTSEDSDAVDDAVASDGEETSETDVDDGSALHSATERYLPGGIWEGDRGETYSFKPGRKGMGHWSCMRQDTTGTSKMFTVAYDWDYDLIWWGTTGAYFASAAELAENPDELRWYGGKDTNMRKPKFSWHLQGESAHDNDESIVEKAIEEITASLKDPANPDGYVWVQGWNERYARRGLGHVKTFIESHADKFIVKPKKGKNAYSVALVDADVSEAGSTADSKSRKGAGKKSNKYASKRSA